MSNDLLETCVDIPVAETLEDSLEQARQRQVDHRLLQSVDVLLSSEYSMSQSCFVQPDEVIDNPLGWFDEEAATQLPESDVYCVRWDGGSPYLSVPECPWSLLPSSNSICAGLHPHDDLVGPPRETIFTHMFNLLNRRVEAPWVMARIVNVRYNPDLDRSRWSIADGFRIGVDPPGAERDRSVLTIGRHDFTLVADDRVKNGIVVARQIPRFTSTCMCSRPGYHSEPDPTGVYHSLLVRDTDDWQCTELFDPRFQGGLEARHE